MTDILDLIACPVCSSPMTRCPGCLKCSSGHSFDVSRAGYVNMLPPGKEKNSRSGDEREMVRGREEFLSHGHYDRFTDTISEIIKKYAPASRLSICDMGSGEGYHTCRLTELLRHDGLETLSVGFDASKYAAERASRHSMQLGLLPRSGIASPDCSALSSAAYFMPGNIFRLPLNDSSFDVCLSLFAPIAWDEAARILKNGGILIAASSGMEHLIEMRRIIYDEVHTAEKLPTAGHAFAGLDMIPLKYSFTLDRGDLCALFKMTPFYYKTTSAGRARLESADCPISLTAHVNFSVFKVDKPTNNGADTK